MKRACTTSQMEERKKEIVQAVNLMFDELDYQDISMKTISERISIARSSLYCYYQSKEEIMLDVLKDEYHIFLDDLLDEFLNKDETKEELAEHLSEVYLSHLRLLKIVSVYLTDIEDHCSLESLIAFKRGFVQPFDDLFQAVKTRFPKSNLEDQETFFNALMMLTHGLYPMICPHEKQVQAMKEVGMMTHDDGLAYCRSYFRFLLKNM